MSQLQFQCPASPMPAAPAPLQLGQPQPGYSIPCASGTLPSESASQPIRSSALPAGSATPYNTTTVSNMANPKEKTPMCLVNELARFNKIQPEYKLLCEQGPAHSKIFSVRLTLGDQHWEAEGTSIKKAQHSAAASALAETTLPKPTVRTPRNTADGITHTMELNALCMKLGKKPMYKPIDPYPGMRPPNFNYNVRAPGPYQRSMQQYYYPFPPVGPMLYHMELSIGGQQFIGKGRTRQLAKHDAAAKALKVLQKEPILQQLPVMNGEPEEENLNKSEISQVFEIALKRNLPVNFEVLKEEGPPHMKSFVVRVTVGEFMGEGEGKSKKIAKKLAAAAVLGELKRLPHIPSVEKTLPRIKKKTKSIIKLQTSPEYGQGMNPISRLAQIQQAKKEKEPEYSMVTERGLPRRREFVMQVTVCGQSAEGMGPSKKVAKRNAAEKMLELLGYKVPQPQPPKPALKTDEKTPVKKPGDGRKVTFFEPGSVEDVALGSKEEDFRLPYLSHQQLPAGILPMVPEVAQAVGACQGSQAKDYSRAMPNPGKATITAMIANELLYAGTSLTAETILKNKNNLNQLPHGPLTRPSEQLGYLASVQALQVEYKDFPKNNKNEFVSLINCSSQPPLISHGIGKDVESCHDMAALNILKLLSELDQQSNERPGNGPVSGCGKQEIEEKTQVRLVFLGAAGVGKTALIRRFLQDTFEAKHRRTVEELHSKEYDIGGVKVTVEILDTSGSYSFPAMRKLSIQNSDAFALVYAVDDPESLEAVKSLRDEILEIKEDKYTPIVVVGNKVDRGEERQVSSEDVLSTVEMDWNNSYLEASAKENANVVEVFKELLQQANLPSRLSPALRRRRETFPKDTNFRPPMNKTNSCILS